MQDMLDTLLICSCHLRTGVEECMSAMHRNRRDATGEPGDWIHQTGAPTAAEHEA